MVNHLSIGSTSSSCDREPMMGAISSRRNRIAKEWSFCWVLCIEHELCPYGFPITVVPSLKNSIAKFKIYGTPVHSNQVLLLTPVHDDDDDWWRWVILTLEIYCQRNKLTSRFVGRFCSSFLKSSVVSEIWPAFSLSLTLIWCQESDGFRFVVFWTIMSRGSPICYAVTTDHNSFRCHHSNSLLKRSRFFRVRMNDFTRTREANNRNKINRMTRRTSLLRSR